MQKFWIVSSIKIFMQYNNILLFVKPGARHLLGPKLKTKQKLDPPKVGKKFGKMNIFTKYRFESRWHHRESRHAPHKKGVKQN